jgi:hypothetical protein
MSDTRELLDDMSSHRLQARPPPPAPRKAPGRLACWTRAVSWLAGGFVRRLYARANARGPGRVLTARVDCLTGRAPASAPARVPAGLGADGHCRNAPVRSRAALTAREGGLRAHPLFSCSGHASKASCADGAGFMCRDVPVEEILLRWIEMVTGLEITSFGSILIDGSLTKLSVDLKVAASEATTK